MTDLLDNEDPKDLLCKIGTENNYVNSSDDNNSIEITSLLQRRNGDSSYDYSVEDSF